MSIAVRVLCLIGVFVASANAAEVYVNGVKVTGSLKEQAFQGVNVQFNGTGDVFINAPGIKVEMSEEQKISSMATLRNRTVASYVTHVHICGGKVTMLAFELM